MELISRDEVMRLAENGRLLSGSFGERAKDIIKAIPTVEERKEGHWIRDGHHIRCSECFEYICDKDREGDTIPQNFCPNCGARMKGE